MSKLTRAEKRAKDREFFRDMWQMMRGSEGYIVAVYFWLLSVVLVGGVIVLTSAVVNALIAEAVYAGHY